MAKSLHDKFPEYKRVKFKVFRVTVEDCFNKILTALNKESESPQKETPKETTKEKEVPKEAPNEKEASKETPKEPPKELPKGIFKLRKFSIGTQLCPSKL